MLSMKDRLEQIKNTCQVSYDFCSEWFYKYKSGPLFEDDKGRVLIPKKHLEIFLNAIELLKPMYDLKEELDAKCDVLIDALEMVRSADDDCKEDGLPRWCTDIARAKIDKAIKIAKQ